MRQYASGVAGEQAAETWLCQHGMTCLDRRYRAQNGEIDLVMQDVDGTIAFVEVKYRPNGRPGDGLRAVTRDKQQRTLHAAQAWLIEHNMTERPARFDALEITSAGVIHIPNAWMA